jgi:hypothetical protein
VLESAPVVVGSRPVLDDVPPAVASPAVLSLDSLDVAGAVVIVPAAVPLLELSSGSCDWSSAGHPNRKIAASQARCMARSIPADQELLSEIRDLLGAQQRP